MSHPKQRPYDSLVKDYANPEYSRPLKRRSPNPTRRQRHSPGPITQTHQQAPSSHLSIPQTYQANNFKQRSFDFRPAYGATQGDPPLDPWPDLPPQNNYQDRAGNIFQSPSDENSFYPVGMPGYVHNWTGEPPPPQQSFDWNAPVIGHPQFGNPYDDAHRATNEANWSALGSPAPASFINSPPSQPTSGVIPAPPPSHDTYYPPMINALGGTFGNEEIEAAYGCTLPAQTFDGDDSVQESKYSQYPQDAAKTDDVGSWAHGASLAMSNAARTRHQVSRPKSKQSESLRLVSIRRVDCGPSADGRLRPGDNRPPQRLNNPIVDFPQDSLSLTLRTNFSPDSMNFLEPRPDPGDVSKIPSGTCKSGCLIMGVFGGILSMSYVHPALPAGLSAGQKLETCSAADNFMRQRLSEKGNEIISLIPNSYRSTTLLPKSTVEKSNGIVTLQKPTTGKVLAPSSRYTDGDIQQASLCVAAAAISTYISSCRPVFDQATYDRIRIGAEKLTKKPGAALPSGVNNLSHDELNKLFQVSSEWGDRRLPRVQIAGQWVGDGPEVMSVDSG